MRRGEQSPSGVKETSGPRERFTRLTGLHPELRDEARRQALDELATATSCIIRCYGARSCCA